MNEKSALAGRHAGERTCPRCGARFVCGMEAGEKRCWCAELPAIVPSDPARAGCLCPACLRAIALPPG